MRRVVVTGAAGFVGQHLVRSLVSDGVPVVGIVLAGSDNPPLEIPVLAISQPDELGRAVCDADATEVIHLGGVIDNRVTQEALAQTLTANFLSTVGLLQALVGTPVRRVVLMGSCEEYGRNPVPFDVRMAVDPPTPYAASKAAVTAYARMFHHAFGLGTVVLRPAVIYGAGQNPRMLISDVMSALAAGREVAVTLGEQQRDFLYIDDMVSAIKQALQAPSIDGLTLNIGTGVSTTVRECVEAIEELFGRPGLVRWGARPYSANEVFHYNPDCAEAKALLGWEAKIDVRTGLARMFAEVRTKA